MKYPAESFILIDEYVSRPDMNKFHLVRRGKKHFIVKRLTGAVLATYKCGYPEAQRQFATFLVTQRLLNNHALHTNEHWG